MDMLSQSQPGWMLSRGRRRAIRQRLAAYRRGLVLAALANLL